MRASCLDDGGVEVGQVMDWNPGSRFSMRRSSDGF